MEITVPGDYNLWSSGLLQNASEIYTEKFLTRIKEASTSDAIHHIITKADRETNEITKKTR